MIDRERSYLLASTSAIYLMLLVRMDVKKTVVSESVLFDL